MHMIVQDGAGFYIRDGDPETPKRAVFRTKEKPETAALRYFQWVVGILSLPAVK
jgi:hypothetical protein